MELVANLHHYYGLHAETLANAVKAGVDGMSDRPEAVAQGSPGGLGSWPHNRGGNRLKPCGIYSAQSCVLVFMTGSPATLMTG